MSTFQKFDRSTTSFFIESTRTNLFEINFDCGCKKGSVQFLERTLVLVTFKKDQTVNYGVKLRISYFKDFYTTLVDQFIYFLVLVV